MCWEEEKGLHVFKSDYVDINFIYLFYTKGQEHNGEAPAHQPDPDLPHVTNAAMSSWACSTAASISRCTCFYSCITLTTALDFVLVFSFAVYYQSFVFVH